MVLPSDRISLHAPAKINLYLKVTGRREDGYHYLATLMQKISLCDRIDLEKKKSGIELKCPDSELSENESNLAFRAAETFLQRTKNRITGSESGVAITLSKSIPVAAGLGGGSSDAAAVLKGLDTLYSVNCTEEELMAMGVSLGADVPFFITELPAVWATGIGDRLQQAIPLTGYSILIVNPGYSVSTPWVYENFALTVEQKINNLKNFQNLDYVPGNHDFSDRAIRPEELMNDLEKVTTSHYPKIEQLKERLMKWGAAAALMTGSGPTVFGLFAASKAGEAAACEQELKRKYPSTYLVDPLQS